ncbi:MAG TPA: hypothetical protein PKJ45_11830 [Rubrivivax sp.]|nr:hypothetical protein [Rubrivivax sp.]
MLMKPATRRETAMKGCKASKAKAAGKKPASKIAHHVLRAIGVDAAGDKHLLGLAADCSENAAFKLQARAGIDKRPQQAQRLPAARAAARSPNNGGAAHA